MLRLNCYRRHKNIHLFKKKIVSIFTVCVTLVSMNMNVIYSYAKAKIFGWKKSNKQTDRQTKMKNHLISFLLKVHFCMSIHSIVEHFFARTNVWLLYRNKRLEFNANTLSKASVTLHLKCILTYKEKMFTMWNFKGKIKSFAIFCLEILFLLCVTHTHSSGVYQMQMQNHPILTGIRKICVFLSLLPLLLSFICHKMNSNSNDWIDFH